MEQISLQQSYSLPADREPFSVKQTAKWYVPFAEYTIAECRSLTDHTSDKDLLDAANGTLSSSIFNYMMTPFKTNANDNPLKDFEFPGDIRDTGIIKDILIKLLSEFISLPDHFEVKIHNSDYIFRKNEAIRREVTPLLQQAIINKINEEQQKQGNNVGEQRPVPNIPEFVEKFKRNYLDDRAIDGQDRLDAFREWSDDSILYNEAYFYWLVTGKYYINRSIVGNEVLKECVNPIEFSPLRSGDPYVCNYDGGVRMKYMTLSEVLDSFETDLSKENVKFLEQLRSEYVNSDGSVIIPYSTYKTLRPDMTFTNEMDATYSGNELRLTVNAHIIVTHIVRKSSRKIGILKYQLNGMEFEREVDDTYTFDASKGDLDIEWRYIQYPLEMYKIGGTSETGNITALYTKPKWCDLALGINNGLLKNMIPYSGKEGLFTTEFNHSVVLRLLPFEVYDRVFRLAQERILYKEMVFNKVTLLPKSLLTGNKETVAGKLFNITADGMLLYDDTDSAQREAVSNPNLFRVIDKSASNLLERLSLMIRENKQDAWDAIGWNRQRDGQTFASDGKGTNEMAIQRSMMSTLFLYYMFNKSREKDYEIDLEYTKITDINYTKQDSMGMFTTSSGETKALSIDGLIHADTEYGVYATNASEEYLKLQEYKKAAFNLGQNGEYELIGLAIDSNSSAKIRKRLEEFGEMIRSREEIKQALDRQSMEKVAADNLAAKREELDLLRAKTLYEGEVDIEVAAIQSARGNEAAGGGGMDTAKQIIEQAKLRLKERELALKDKAQTDSNILKEKALKKATK